jgi:peptidoglycan/xylan/chitin deacetylase (PgdA/CDA1 family)
MHTRVGIKRIIKSNAALIASLAPGGDAGRESIVVLMYHRVNSVRRNELSITPETFRRQLEWLKANRYESMRLCEFTERPESSNPSSPRIIFTFDDGYEDNYVHAAPLVREFGYTAIFYIPCDFIETGRMVRRDAQESGSLSHNSRMTWNQISDLIGTGMEIGSHTISHRSLTQISPEEAWDEISESKKRLEDKLGTKITSFCYPRGLYDSSHVEMVRTAGYATACTASPDRGSAADPLQIPRSPVQRSDGFFIFRQKMKRGARFFGSVR